MGDFVLCVCDFFNIFRFFIVYLFLAPTFVLKL
jgi:hypothetical protein